MFPDLYRSLQSSLQPLMAINTSEMTLFRSLMPDNSKSIERGSDGDSAECIDSDVEETDVPDSCNPIGFNGESRI